MKIVDQVSIIGDVICEFSGIAKDKSFLELPRKYRPYGVSDGKLSIHHHEYELDATSPETIRMSVLKVLPNVTD